MHLPSGRVLRLPVDCSATSGWKLSSISSKKWPGLRDAEVGIGEIVCCRITTFGFSDLAIRLARNQGADLSGRVEKRLLFLSSMLVATQNAGRAPNRVTSGSPLERIDNEARDQARPLTSVGNSSSCVKPSSPVYEDLTRYGLERFEFNLFQQPAKAEIVKPVAKQPMKTLAISSAKRTKLQPSKRTTNDTRVKHEVDMAEEEEEEEEGVGWLVYCLLSADRKKTYVGVTSNLTRRMRQHNGELVGGAKSTETGRPWTVLCCISGFNTRSEAFQFEWRWKNTTASKKGSDVVQAVAGDSPAVGRRRASLYEVQKHFSEWQHLQFVWMQ